ncbi:MAG: hypothetical protein K2W97_02220 [Chthoniobacterales bacterium]|nr:hypothetical protein [Chthoniobacterales bacterium]
MKILLTVDLDHPACPERASTECLLHYLWDQLQVPSFSTIDILAKQLSDTSILEWAKIIALKKHAEQYRQFARIPLEEYDLVIGCNLRPEIETLFTSLGVRCLTVREVPCLGFSRFLLARANFKIPTEYSVQLPCLSNLYNENIPFVDIPQEEKGWWIANRFLINQTHSYPKNLFIGTTLFQPERIVDDKIVNLASYADEIKEILLTAPDPFYTTRQPADQEEIRFFKMIGGTLPCLPLPRLLARREFDKIISIDSGLIPVARAFDKPIQILGKERDWEVIQLRQFRNTDFFKKLFEEALLES